MKIVHFYARPNCQLCDEGLLTLKLVQEDCPFKLTIINIEESDVLHEQYMLMIPVVTYDEQILQYGQLDYVTLLEALNE